MARKTIEIEGRQVGRLKAGWILFKEAWRYFQSDKEMVFIPLITGLINVLLFGVVMTAAFFLILNGTLSVSAEGESATVGEYIFLFVMYVIGAFTLALSQAGIAHTVYTRAHGGDATLGDSLKVAFTHSASLFIWALITATVGVVLRMIAERSKLLGRLVVAIFGIAWSVLTYFVVPAIVLDKKSAPAAIGHSVQVFKRTWGETAVSNISLSVVFILMYVFLLLAGFGLGVFLVSAGAGQVAWLVVILMLIIFLVVGLIQSALEGVVKTLLYIYASEGIQPPNFNPELLERMLVRKDGTYPQPAAAPATFSPQSSTDNASPSHTSFQ